MRGLIRFNFIYKTVFYGDYLFVKLIKEQKNLCTLNIFSNFARSNIFV